ncbi:hypothetical protein [Pseudomonas viridiflava]|uniref:hypothetical protein n=1 Tax=Pseudomonas viridiflava TaxID=33069 RepID=UPI000F011B52|nr:hypothetical protein [Pseudomonas viridiflava]
MPIRKQMNQVGTDAITTFTKLHNRASVSGGPVSGTNGHSFVIDCAITKLRLAVTAIEGRPNDFAIGVNPKNATGTPNFDVLPLSSLTVATLLSYMNPHFHK